MKKKILLACLVGSLSATSAYSYTGECKGGTIVESTTGTTFCRSNKTMNWWSSQAWCQANGSQLATIYEMCPSWNGNISSYTCPEWNGNVTQDAWSATAEGSKTAISVRLPDGFVRSGLRSGDNYAFCR